MLKFTNEKQPAFFHAMSPELFFEAEALDTQAVMENLAADTEVDAELEALLSQDTE